MNLHSQTRNQTNLLFNYKFWLLTVILFLLYSTIIFAQNTVYVDPTNGGDPGQDGSIDHPWASWSDVTPQSNTNYLQKRGTVETRTSPLITLSHMSGDLHDIYIGAYGTGDRPQIYFNSGSNGIYLKYTRNITIENLELIGNVDANPGDVFHSEAILLSGHTMAAPNTTQTTIRNVKIHQWGGGITSMVFNTSGATTVDTVFVDNVEIFDIGEDGMFGTFENLTVQNSHIYRVNRHWFTVGHSQTQSGGDCIHFRGNNYLIQNNILDRSTTGNKFCLIYGSQTYHPDRGQILWNTFYPPQDTIGDDGGACIYISHSAYVEIAYNKFIGRGYNGAYQQPGGGMHNQADTVNFYYNLADSISGFNCTMDGSIPNKELNFLNNTFVNQYDDSFPVIMTWDSTTAKNNIFAIEEGIEPFLLFGGFIPDTSNNIVAVGNSSNWGTNPGFVDWQNFNYRIKETSPATNAGSNYAGCYCDLDSIPVPQQSDRDIGVYEYTEGGSSNSSPIINSQSFNLPENSANGQTVGTVIASDPDAGQTLTYTILSGNTGNAFQIGATTGVLTILNSSVLDFETNPVFGLTVRVQDDGPGNLTAEATVTVDLTDVNEAPVINNQNFALDENAPNGQEVGTIVATDPDNGQNLVFSIVSGNNDNAFTLHPISGILTVATSSVLDFETNPEFNLVIQVNDDGTGYLFDQATITVNLTDVNEAPVINNASYTIDENSPNGQQLGTLVATDPDNGQTLTYSIISGNTNNAFHIGASSGVLSVANSTAIDFESTPVFTLTVQVQDNGTGNLTDQATVTVNLTDINEVPEINNQSFAVPENSPNGQQVGTIVATDPDNGQSLTFSIVSGNTNNAFQIQPTSGLLTVASSSVLDFETNPAFSLTIQVEDDGNGNLSDQATITINLTDVNEAPEINDQSFNIDENTANGQQIGTLIATDPDNGQTLTYTIISGNTSNAFQIGSTSGVLSVANNSAIDFETNPVFSLVVNVHDNGQGNLSDQATVTVNLNDLNEVPIIFDQSFVVELPVVNGELVGVVIASDPDAGQTLTYSIISGDPENAFQIDALSGEITIADNTALDFVANPVYYLDVQVQDDGDGNLENQAVITVSPSGVNQVPNISNQSFSIDENSPAGQEVGLVIASDPDNGQTLTYSIISGNTGNAFQIGSASGILSVDNASVLNYEENQTFSLIVQVQDNGVGNLTNQATITVDLNDVNEVPEINDENFAIDENIPEGQQVGVVTASDPDNGQTLTYSIISGNTDNAFQIGSASGVLSVSNSLAIDFETNPDFNIIVEVQDNGQGNLSAQAEVTISVNDVNEVPEIENQSFVVEQSIGNGELVGVVIASDPDNGQTLTFSLIGGDPEGAFQIDPVSGEITIADYMALDFYANPVYSLDVQVQDDGVGNLTNQAIITVSPIDLNQVPNISNQSFSIEENSSVGQEVGLVIAIDPDAGQTLTYSIISGNTENTFQIGSTTGILSVANNSLLNYEENQTFDLTVQVQDDGVGNLTAEATITVDIIDVNESPSIEDQVYTVNEFSPNGEEVGYVEASDPDGGQTLTYSIISGNTDDAFELDPETGIITVNNSSALDFGVNPYFILSVEVQDDGTGNLTDMANIYIGVIDITNIGGQAGSNDFSSTIYPNPANEFLNVEMENLSDDELYISIANMNGEIIMQREYHEFDRNFVERFETGNLSKGFYIINIINGKATKMDKFIKM